MQTGELRREKKKRMTRQSVKGQLTHLKATIMCPLLETGLVVSR